jgi:hypothetical protein
VGRPHGRPLAFGDVETYVGSGPLWERQETDIAKALAGQTAPHVFMPPQPSRTALAVSSTTDGALEERWYSLRDGGVARMKSAAQIASEIAARGGPRPAGWVAWLLSPGGPPQVLARQPYLINEAHSDDSLRSEFSTDVSFAAWVPGDYVVVGCNADSVYLLNLKSNSARVLFHPGDELLKISVSRDGLVAVYMRGGYKCYIMRPDGVPV